MAKRVAIVTVFLALVLARFASAQQVDAQEYTLENGMTLLMAPRSGDPNVAAGWVAKVGSAYERPGITGVAHLFEHMMFKGTYIIGTTDIEADLRIIEQLDDVKAELREEQQRLLDAHWLGQIDDPDDPDLRSPRHTALLKQFDELLARQKGLLISTEIDRIYASHGASFLNAATFYDWTRYQVSVPANKLELWFWLESDRLANPVFREFYSERDVVHEERRRSTDSTPTGKFDEQFTAMFWQSSPYSWPIVGWPSDLEGITREEALAFFEVYYAPNNLTAVLVGDFDPDQAIAFARQYFGRLPRGVKPPVRPRTREMPQLAEKRMVAYAETTPQVAIWYHSVPDGHVDEPAIVVLGQILNGRTGRLYKSLVEEQEVANSASAGQAGYGFEGSFELRGTAKPGKTPEDVEQALYRELEKLQAEPVTDRELQKVKNQNAARNFRSLRSNFGLMLELLVRSAWRSWATINTDPALYEAVTAEDIMRVANTYFAPENRAVAIYYRKDTTAEEDPRLSALDEEERQQVRQLQAMIGQMNAEQIGQFIGQFEQMATQGPADNQDMFEVVLEILRAQLTELGGG